MEIELRREEEKDHEAVEELTREAFWNVYVPGCGEHLVLHNLRKAKEFVKELDFVAVCGGKIAGNIVYAESKVAGGGREHTVLTFGPLSVLPEFQNRGIGGKLIGHTVQRAKEAGYGAIIIYGYPEYYERFGFRVSKEYGITNRDGKYPAALLVLELRPGALDGVNGMFDEGTVYGTDENELREFEKRFSKKEKMATKSQERFLETANRYL